MSIDGYIILNFALQDFDRERCPSRTAAARKAFLVRSGACRVLVDTSAIMRDLTERYDALGVFCGVWLGERVIERILHGEMLLCTA